MGDMYEVIGNVYPEHIQPNIYIYRKSNPYWGENTENKT